MSYEIEIRDILNKSLPSHVTQKGIDILTEFLSSLTRQELMDLSYALLAIMELHNEYKRKNY